MSDQPILEQNAKTALPLKEAIAYLAEKFPLCFFAEGTVKPLKIGLFQDLVDALVGDEKLSKTQLRHVLRAYTSNWRYLHACSEVGAVRVDLAGNPAGEIDAQQAEHAAQTLAISKEAYNKRREEQRQAKAQEKKELTPEQKAERKAYFQQKAREENAKKRAEQKAKRSEKAPKNRPAKVVNQAENLTALTAQEIQKGQAVKVKVGNSVQAATVLGFEKADVRVQLQSGLTLNVNVEHLFA